MDPHDERAQITNLFNPSYRPDFEGDFLTIPDATLGEHTYTRIVFQGCCPIATEMGGRPCGANESYPKIEMERLADKLGNLISKNGGFLFFRHCAEAANEKGIADPGRRQRFIETFEARGFQLQRQFYAPLRLTSAHPGPDIPDPHPSVKDKWEGRNGGAIFFLPHR